MRVYYPFEARKIAGHATSKKKKKKKRKKKKKNRNVSRRRYSRLREFSFRGGSKLFNCEALSLSLSPGRSPKAVQFARMGFSLNANAGLYIPIPSFPIPPRNLSFRFETPFLPSLRFRDSFVTKKIEFERERERERKGERRTPTRAPNPPVLCKAPSGRSAIFPPLSPRRW